MEIDTTKIGKHFIISPTIEVNKLRAYDDIVVSNTSFRELFDGTESKFVDARDFLNESVYVAEQIHAFKCCVSDYVGGRFKSVTLRHDSSTGSAEAGRSEVWLFVTILDENSNVVDTFFSTNKARQISTQTTWIFDSIEIKENYKIFEFRMTSEEGVANRRPASNSKNLRSFSMKETNNDSKLSIVNWSTVEQNGVEASYATDCSLEIEVDRINVRDEIEIIKNDLSSHSSDIEIHHTSSEINDMIQNHPWMTGCVTMCNQLDASLRNHSNDSSIHLTENNVNDLISSHVSSTPHLSESDVNSIINSSNFKSETDTHISDTSIHLTSDVVNNLINTSEVKNNLDSHKNDSSIHLTEENVNSILSSHTSSVPHLSENEVENLINNSAVKTDLDNHKSDSSIHLNSDSVNNLIINSPIRSSLDAHINDDSLHLSSSDVSTIISESDLNNTVSSLEDGAKINDSILKNYLRDREHHTYDVCYDETANRYVSIIEEVIDSFATDTSLFRGNYISSITIRKKEGDTYSQLPIANTPAWLYATCFDENNNVVKVVFSSNNTIQNPNENLVTWTFDDFLVTSDIKTIEYAISFTNGVQEKRGKIRSASIRSNGVKITKEGWYTVDGANTKVTFITDLIVGYESPIPSGQGISYTTTVEDGDILDNYTAKGFQLGRLHIKPGKLKKIIIPFSSSNDDTRGTFYLAAQIFKYGDIDTAQQNKTKDETKFSNNSFFIGSGSNGYYSFTFDDIVIPEDFQFVRFMLVTSKDDAPNGVSLSNCASMRIKPIKRNNNFLTFDTDECSIIETNGNKANYLTACYFTYEGNVNKNEIYYSNKWRLEFNTVGDYIKNMYDDISNSPYVSMSASKITRTGFDLSTLTNIESSQEIILIDVNFNIPVSNMYVESYIKRYSSENLPSILPIF